MSGAAAGAAAGAAVAIANATKASGVIVRVSPEDFVAIVRRADRPLVVHAERGVFRTRYQFLTSYRGLAFYTKSDSPLALPPDVETVRARSIWVPG